MIQVLIILIVIGVLLYVVNTMIPIDGKIKMLINIIVILGTVIWLLKVFGLLGGMNNIRI